MILQGNYAKQFYWAVVWLSGLKVKVITKENKDKAEGTVLQQSVSGKEVEAGTEVTITVSKKPENNGNTNTNTNTQTNNTVNNTTDNKPDDKPSSNIVE